LAASIQITAVTVNPTNSGVDIVLEQQDSNSSSSHATRDRPQIFTLSQGNSWIADITNTQLRLPGQNQRFQRNNPAPGIASISVIASSANSIRVTVTGETASPAGQVSQQAQGGFILSLVHTLVSPAATSPTPAPKPPTPKPTNVAESDNPVATPILPPPPPQPASSPPQPVPSSAPTLPTSSQPGVKPDEKGTGTSSSPPALPAAPPAAKDTPTVKNNPANGISYSDVDVSPPTVNLGTTVRIDRLVLRETPVREVLALLARTVDLGIVYTEDASASPGAAQPSGSAIDSSISLDIENELVQDVFNYVLQAKGLKANRVGKTIFIGQNLPATTGNYIARTLRLNQMQATLPQTNITMTKTTASSLTSGGGQGSSTTNSQVGRTSTTTENVPTRGALQILEELGANGSSTAKSSVFKGVQVTADARTNTLTLLGTPVLVQAVTDYLNKLDMRRKQVAVNVKIVEVDLTKSSTMGASFSFGVSDNFFNVNQGQGTANFGRFNPSLANTANSLTSPPTIANPYAAVQPPINTNAPIVNSQGTTLGFQPASPTSANPLSAVVTNLTGGSVSTSNTVTTVLNQAVTYGLPPLFQYPAQFLLNLQAQVTSGNAKILTDPTLIVQEGSQSQVNLTSQVFSGFTEQRVTEGNVTTTRILPQAPVDVGVILNIQIERIDDNNFITLALSPEVSSLGQQITDPSRNNLLIQQLVNRRRLETGTIRLRDGQTLILTGIIQEQDRTTITKVPILGDIPLLNLLFRNKRKEHERNEVVILVTPQIIDDSSNIPYGYKYTPGAELNQLLRQGNPPINNPPK
jgi:type IV pilus assembly protein PilQ